MATPIGDPRPAGQSGPAGDTRQAGQDGPAGDPRPSGGTSTPTDTTSTYDPGKHTVSEVLDYLDTADDNEKDRVIRMEGEGKARTSIIG